MREKSYKIQTIFIEQKIKVKKIVTVKIKDFNRI